LPEGGAGVITENAGTIIPVRKKVLKRAIYIFIITMLLLTFLSSTLNNLGLTRVTAADAQSGCLSYSVEAQTVVTPLELHEVYPDNALRVKSINVSKGDNVSKGQMLAEFDVEELADELNVKTSELEIKKLEADLAEQRSGFEIKNAGDKAASAQNVLDSATALYDAGAETTANIEALKTAYEDAKKECERLQMERKAAQAKSHIELNQLEEVIASLKRRITEAQTLYSPIDGCIWEIGAGKGTMTDITKPMFSIANNRSGFHAEFCITMQEGKYLGAGDDVRVDIPSLGKREINAVIDSITSVRNDTDTVLKINILLDDTDLKGGELAEISIKKESGIYDTIVPNTAIHEDSSGRKFVYVIKERKSSLGREFYLQKAFIYIEASDKLNSAVEDGLNPFERVVTESSRPVFAGDRVKIQRD
jgi:HlyD family secretion protein